MSFPPSGASAASPEYAASVREIDQTLKVTNATLVKVPFDLDHWKIDRRRPIPQRPPRTLFQRPHPMDLPRRSVPEAQFGTRRPNAPTTALLALDAMVLQVAVARLLGYRWPAELDPAMRLAPEQRDVADDCRAFDEFADPDGIVCLSAARGESNAADRLRESARARLR